MILWVRRMSGREREKKKKRNKSSKIFLFCLIFLVSCILRKPRNQWWFLLLIFIHMMYMIFFLSSFFLFLLLFTFRFMDEQCSSGSESSCLFFFSLSISIMIFHSTHASMSCCFRFLLARQLAMSSYLYESSLWWLCFVFFFLFYNKTRTDRYDTNDIRVRIFNSRILINPTQNLIK